jgi:hypothetical protein
MSVHPNREDLSNGATPSATYVDMPHLPKETCQRRALVCPWRCGPDGRLMMIWSVASALDSASRSLMPEGTDAREAGDERNELPRTHAPMNEAA